MVFYSSKKILINSLLSLMGLIAIGLAFQNCSNGLSSSSPASNTATSDTPGGMRVISDDNTGSSTTTGSTELKIELLATDLLKVDCSIPGASYKFEVSNAGADITMCQEYTLDMPQGNSRYGESYKCDSGDKFVKPSSPLWSYDVGQRKWSKITYTNAQQYIPGDYRLYVRDNLGEVKSSLLKIRHYGYANCVNPNPVIAEQPGTGGGSSSSGGAISVVTSCSWSGEDFSPAQPPQSVCSQSRANAKENGASGVVYTCVCTQATVVVPPSSGGSNTGAGSSGGGSTTTVTTPSSGPVAPGTTCNPLGTKLVRFNTQLPDKAFGRTDYPMMKENEIYVFAFKTANTTEVATQSMTATILSSSRGTPNVFVSECPGNINPVATSEGCYVHSVESATVRTLIGLTPDQVLARGGLPRTKCFLKPNTQYYASVFLATKDSEVATDGNGRIIKVLPPTSGCVQPGWCGLSFTGN